MYVTAVKLMLHYLNCNDCWTFELCCVVHAAVVLHSVAVVVTAVDLFFWQDNVFERVTCIYSNIALDTHTHTPAQTHAHGHAVHCAYSKFSHSDNRM